MGNNKRLQKSVKRYLSKMKSSSRSLQRPQLQLSSLNNSMMMSTKSFLSNCKHPKTQSIALDETQERGGGSSKPRDDEAAAQLEDIDKFLFENFRSLYLRDVDVDVDSNHCVDDDNHYNKTENEEVKKKGKESKIILDSPRSMDEFYLRRGSSSSSSSLVDELFRNSLTMSEEISGDPTKTPNNNNMVDRKVLEGSIAVLTYSTNPYEDFKKSMQEMVETRKRGGDDGSIDWELMEEMLFCFIKLNDKKSYKYLINAFVDLVITLRAQTTTLQQLPAPPTAAPTTVMSVRRKKRPDYF